ncbi:MAG: aminotransferase class V-fold PLP-dependent enzyme [Deltaproteobacteria bacterium]|nr:aminotransferase class V-fold PLP-dependent enzyme [Deltaproteobacteria bacterium]
MTPGRPFLQIPGPTLVPDRVTRAMSQPMIDHRGPKFAALLREILNGLKKLFKSASGQIVLFPGSGTGGWESCVVNTLSPGDLVLGCVNGYFSDLFCRTAKLHGIEVETLELPYGLGIPADQIEQRLRADSGRRIKAVLVVHNETSTGVTTDVAAIRQAMERASHPALLLVDVVSSLGCIDLRFDDWKLDVALAAPQKGLMMPPGMAILAVSERALQANESAKCGRAFWDWRPVLENNAAGQFPYTPATALLFGMSESLKMIFEEGLENVFNRHARLAEACRRATQAMNLKLFPRNPAEYSNTLTAVSMPDEYDADGFINHMLRRFDLSLGKGLGKARGKLFRIGHLGSLNELELLGALAAVEMALFSFGVKLPLGAGLSAAEAYLLESAPNLPST